MIAAFASSCCSTTCSPDPGPDAFAAHAAYVEAINSNDLDQLMEMMTDDVVFLAPNTPIMVGKAAVFPWCEGYLAAYTLHWEKHPEEFILAGEWAIELYSYESADEPKDGGPVPRDTGKGINVYHHDADGRWRVARDAWNSDLPLE